ncbi:Nuclear hormone receptor family member nhr-65 [Caenorhabditis elegans]|uniref:Nuclear hormone receptor family member nhr-65 n=1 Tax=Caenorhabditis elegans TaxID=6239 RepID=NHR65_CAEEL|nr:Nuclear hormone receptor family member nhr-65 [Caenorhabditis elegans]O45907.1 RecName: Full=Nuclear hormone receptor family member nhr-65 [Caenorhabditis elegans]CAA16292.1 Nuclear hormone receptor family member nhr-65 [Caenorhabditis elegans]|eukprot:NP_001024219.1 Nuclear hormone receptor family member nhr-65 [Caenorhabditis elegans]
MELEPCSSSPERCKVCGDTGNGMHFGAFTCRACAAFFRRAASRKFLRKCENHLIFALKCKNCRLQRCYEAGMSSENFQFCRDLIGAKGAIPKLKVPKSFEQTVGRPYFVLQCDPEVLFLRRNIIDCVPLLEKAEKLIEFGSESPVFSKNRLLKLAQGLQQFQDAKSNQVKFVQKMGQKEIMSFFETDFLCATKWFTYLDEFQFLDKNQQLTLMQGIWHVWSRLHKLAVSAMGRRRGICDKNTVMVSHQNEFAVCDLNEIEVDMSWCTNFSNEQMRYFLDTSHDSYVYQVMDEMLGLKPNDVELSYMMCQLCLQYAGQRFQGEILEFCEKMLGFLADDLHSYYVKQLRMPNYAARLAKLMKINNRIKVDMLKMRQRQEISRVFDIWTIDFSHPEFIQDANAC